MLPLDTTVLKSVQPHITYFVCTVLTYQKCAVFGFNVFSEVLSLGGTSISRRKYLTKTSFLFKTIMVVWYFQVVRKYSCFYVCSRKRSVMLVAEDKEPPETYSEKRHRKKTIRSVFHNHWYIIWTPDTLIFVYILIMVLVLTV